MDAVSAAEAAAEKPSARRAIFYGGLLAGVLDLAAAFVSNAIRGASPARVMQSIASGLLGAWSFAGGAPTAALGVLLHFLIAFVWAFIFYIASRRIKFLTAQPLVSGALYGIAVYALMTFLVVPLSAAPFKIRHTFETVAVDVLIHIFCVGLPIAFAVRHYTK